MQESPVAGDMRPHPSLADLRAFALGTLSQHESDRIERHVSDCSSCCDSMQDESPEDGFTQLVQDAARLGESWETCSLNANEDGLPSDGEYQLLEVIGRGGMAVVYKAVHRTLQRVVALKRIRTGPDAGPAEHVRFRREAELAAKLSHPHIVQIHDAGEQDGQPFLAMEYLPGGTLARCLAHSPLPAVESARLVRHLAEAIAAAHRQGIIHRDLKPGNILFALPDSGQPLSERIPKVADFGLARQLDHCAHTRTGTWLGTPSYMAPEQFLEAESVHASADIYSLGVILYECLTGQPPFRSATVVEALDRIRNEEPLRPTWLRPDCPQDLETICLKCLAKDPQGRYRSAEDLADDLSRFVDGRPIVARPTPPWERGWKWARRRPAVSISAVIGLGLFLAIAISGWVVSGVIQSAFVQKRHAESDAREALQLAQDTWNGNLWNISVDVLNDVPGTEIVRQNLLEMAVEQYEQLFAVTGDVPNETRVAYHGLLVSLADHYSETGRVEQADATFRTAIAGADQLSDAQPHSADFVVQAVDARSHLAAHWIRLARWSDAERIVREAERDIKRLDLRNCGSARWMASGAEVLDCLAQCLNHRASSGEARQAAMRAKIWAERAIQADGSNTIVRRVAARVFHNLALANLDHSHSIKLLTKSTSLLRGLVSDRPSSRRDQADLANALLTLGVAFGRKDLTSAREAILEARCLFERLALQFPECADHLDGQARCDANWAALLQQSGQLDQVEYILRQAVDVQIRIAELEPDNPFRRLAVSNTQNQLGLALASQQDNEQAEHYYRAALSTQEKLARQYPSQVLFKLSAVATCVNLGELLRGQERFEDALRVVLPAAAMCRQLWEEDPGHAATRQQALPIHGVAALLLQAVSRHDEAVSAWDIVIQLAPADLALGFRIQQLVCLVDSGNLNEGLHKWAELTHQPAISSEHAAELVRIFARYLEQREEWEQVDSIALYEQRVVHLCSHLAKAGYFEVLEHRQRWVSDQTLSRLRAIPEIATILDNRSH